MPTNRKRIARRRRQIEVAPVLWARLNDDPCPTDTHGFARILYYDFPRESVLRPPWEQHRTAILERWIKRRPGTRPSCWWRFDAPEPDLIIETDPEIAAFTYQRKRLGGKGTPSVGACLALGVPEYWVEDWLCRAKPACTRFDPNDPPQFESEAAYLDRHGLLPSSERRRLRREHFEPEVLPAEFWPDTEGAQVGEPRIVPEHRDDTEPNSHSVP